MTAARLAADRVAAEAGARTVHYVPETPDDVGQQKALVGEALAARPDAVVFVPTDDRPMVEDLRALRRRPASRSSTVINRMEGRFVTFVGSDDVAVGHSAAQALIEGLGGKGDIVAIEGTPAAPTGPRPRRRPAPGPGRGAGDPCCWAPAVGAFQVAPAAAAMARLLAEHPRIDGVWTATT